jgi:hypothetical protein
VAIEKTQTEGVITVAKMTVNLDSGIVHSLLQGDLTCLQSLGKGLIEHTQETKAGEILQVKRHERTPGATPPFASILNKPFTQGRHYFLYFYNGRTCLFCLYN